MDIAALFGLACPAWLSFQVWLPAIVGGVAGVLIVATIHLLSQGAKSAAPAAAPTTAGPPVDPFVEGSASEQRSAHRRTGNPVEIVIRRTFTDGSPVRGFVTDRSNGGLCLLVDQGFEVGMKLHVRPANAPTITPWTEVEVKSSRQTPKGWQVGCQFVRTPPWALLLMFG
jgi:hypothetical protein